MSDEGSVRYFEKLKARGENMTPEQEDRYRIAKENLNMKVKPKGVTGLYNTIKAKYAEKKERDKEITEAYNTAYHQAAVKAAKKKAVKDAASKASSRGNFITGFMKSSMDEMGGVFRNAHANTFGSSGRRQNYNQDVAGIGSLPTWGDESSGRKRKKKRGVYLGGGDIDFI